MKIYDARGVEGAPLTLMAGIYMRRNQITIGNAHTHTPRVKKKKTRDDEREMGVSLMKPRAKPVN